LKVERLRWFMGRESFTFGAGFCSLSFFAWARIIALERFYLTGLPQINAIGLDLKVLAITGGVAILSGLLFGIAPALLAAGTSVEPVPQ